MAKRNSGISGRWRITAMEMWDQDFVDEEVPGYINFAEDGLGDSQFGLADLPAVGRVLQLATDYVASEEAEVK